MELNEAILGRKSIRKFLPDPVPQHDIEEIIRMAGAAPSANNLQMWHFLIITNPELKSRMARVIEETAHRLINHPGLKDYADTLTGMKNYSTFFKDAPAVIAVLKLPYQSKGEEILAKLGMSLAEAKAYRAHPEMQSIGAAIQNLLLAAHSLGYGTCWMTGPLFAKEEITRTLPDNLPGELAALIPLGKPAETVLPRPRKAPEEIMSLI
jgi:nitroreductase